MTEERKPCCLILGAGGHGKVVAEALSLSGRAARIAFVDPDAGLAGKSILESPVAGDDSFLERARDEGFGHFVCGLGGTRDNEARRTLFDKGMGVGLEPLVVLHPAATVSAHAELGDGSVALAGAVINPDARLGRNCIVNSLGLVEHDCRLGDHVHVAPGARVLGGAVVAEMAYIGAGAVIKQGLTVGRGAVIGAGAVVLRDVADGARVAGVPAAPL